MSLCSRGAVFRSGKLNLLRLFPKSIPRSPATTLFSQSRVVPLKSHSDLRTQCRCFSTTFPRREQPAVEPLADSLPVCCPGCGAFSQTVEANEPGYYGTSRKSIRKLLAARKGAIESKVDSANNSSHEGDSVVAEQNDSIEGAVPPQPTQGKSCALLLARAIAD